MPNQIKVKRSETASAVPSLTYGEVGINIADKKIYCGNSANNATLIVDGTATGTTNITGTTMGLLVASSSNMFMP